MHRQENRPYSFLEPTLRGLLGLAIICGLALCEDTKPAQAGNTIPDPTDPICLDRERIDPAAIEFVFFPDGQAVNVASLQEQVSLMKADGVRGQAEKVINDDKDDAGISLSWPLEMMSLQENRQIPPPQVITATRTITDENGLTSIETFTKTKPIIIVIIDSGLNASLEEFRAAIDKDVINPWYDFVERDCDPTDEYGHGTFVTGQQVSSDARVSVVEVTDATDPNKIPVKIYIIRVLNEHNQGIWQHVIFALLMAEGLDADLASLSLGGVVEDPVLFGRILRTLEYLRIHGTNVIAAAGNTPDKPHFMPGCAEGVPNTTALDEQYNGFVLNNTACNLKPESVAGPGVAVYGINYLDGSIMQMSGTSMVAPWMTALVALEMAKGVDFTEALRVVLARLKVPEDWSEEYGRGIFQFDLKNKPQVDDPEPVDMLQLFLPIIFYFKDFSSE